jgi:aldehyde:ferredoxin oxidoreductase
MLLDRKVAFVHLDEGTVKIYPIGTEFRKKFLGGRGVNMALLARYYTPDINPFSPKNPLIFGAGLLAGTLGFGSRLSITSKSPESGHLGDANMGGEFGAEMVKAGLSNLVVMGRSPKPIYLFIQNGHVKIRDAQALKGLDTVETQKKIRTLLGDEKVQVACIGVAGENLVRFAAIRSGLKTSAARTGMGAVMGSKNIKAVAVRGTLDIKIPDPTKYLRSYRGLLKKLMETKWVNALGKSGTPLLFRAANNLGILSVHNNQLTSVGKEGHALEAEALEAFSNGMVSCFACPIHCRHRFCIKEGRYKGLRGEGPEYASIGSLGSKLGNFNLENVIYLVDLCNRYGLDTISTGTYIAWIMELCQRGVITQRTTKHPLVWGNGDVIEEMIHLIAQRKGIGDIVAEGVFAKEALGKASLDYLMEIKNFPIEMTDERLPKSFALGMATSTRGACHMRSRPSLDVIGLPESVLKNLYGGAVSNRLSSYRGKSRMVWWHECLNAVCDALGYCRFASVFSSPHALQYPQFSKLIELVTGIHLTPKALEKAGERIYTLERMILAKDGLSRKDDTLPERYFREPVPQGPARGAFVSRKKFSDMLDEYYTLHGWDNNGVPKKETLKKLGIDFKTQMGWEL